MITSVRESFAIFLSTFSVINSCSSRAAGPLVYFVRPRPYPRMPLPDQRYAQVLPKYTGKVSKRADSIHRINLFQGITL
jgi:hypothetical protein